MGYTIVPNGIVGGLIDIVPQEQIDEIVAGTQPSLVKHNTAELFAAYGKTLQFIIKPCVPDDWGIDYITRNMTMLMSQYDFVEKYPTQSDRIEFNHNYVCERIRKNSDDWFEKQLKPDNRKELYLSIYTIESKIQEKVVEDCYLESTKLDGVLLNYIKAIIELFRKRLKVIKLEEIVAKAKEVPKELFDIWMTNSEKLDRCKSWDLVMNYLKEKRFLRIDGQNLYWEYAKGKKKNVYLAAFLYQLKEFNYIIIEDRKSELYMNLLVKSFNVDLKTPADFTLNSINDLNNSEEVSLFKNLPNYNSI
ncbi:hypothetical protein [Saccharicrinis aurantiacus]|uniref:hypothetical protein n=1 Tax=Saccharicrinis aurantiacus TaxID=1849719 RepID=UPI00094F8E31|nr:hypothetical protein [Saccharicrinis aurantiacus]